MLLSAACGSRPAASGGRPASPVLVRAGRDRRGRLAAPAGPRLARAPSRSRARASRGRPAAIVLGTRRQRLGRRLPDHRHDRLLGCLAFASAAGGRGTRGLTAGEPVPSSMRIALVSPLLLDLPGGVNGHVEALAEQFLGRGDHVRVLAPWDPPDRLSRQPAPLLARGPRAARLPDPARPHLRDRRQRGGLPHLAVPREPRAMRRELRAGGFDVVHVHEPPAPLVSWDANTFRWRARRRHLPRLRDQGAAEPRRHACSAPAALQPAHRADRRLGGGRLDRRRWFGGEYTIVPNGVDVSVGARPAPSRRADHLRCSSSAAPRSARGCRSSSPPSRPGRARPDPPHRGRGRPRGGLRPHRRPRGRWSGSTCSARSPRGCCGGRSARPTSSAPPRSRARASAWS